MTRRPSRDSVNFTAHIRALADMLDKNPDVRFLLERCAQTHNMIANLDITDDERKVLTDTVEAVESVVESYVTSLYQQDTEWGREAQFGLWVAYRAFLVKHSDNPDYGDW